MKDAFMPVVNLVELIGGHVVLAGSAFGTIWRRPYRIKNYIEAMESIGFGSLPIVVLVGVFTGMVTALQSVVAFRTLVLSILPVEQPEPLWRQSLVPC